MPWSGPIAPKRSVCMIGCGVSDSHVRQPEGAPLWASELRCGMATGFLVPQPRSAQAQPCQAALLHMGFSLAVTAHDSDHHVVRRAMARSL
jgi:hypothetical protein